MTTLNGKLEREWENRKRKKSFFADSLLRNNSKIFQEQWYMNSSQSKLISNYNYVLLNV